MSFGAVARWILFGQPGELFPVFVAEIISPSPGSSRVSKKAHFPKCRNLTLSFPSCHTQLYACPSCHVAATSPVSGVFSVRHQENTDEQNMICELI